MRFVFAISFLILFAGLSAHPVRAEGHCSVRGVSFASCAPDVPLFRSVMIAIPGWNGTCASTFGQGAGNLLNVMRRQNFFDVDCFDYDSHHATLEQSRDKLRQRITDLYNAGYREFAFVTHSTGGVLALEFLLAEALTSTGELRTGTQRSKVFQNRDGARLRAMFTWAVPLNGVRKQIDLGSGLINLLGFSPDVLPHLAPGSDYLTALKNRLGLFDAALASATPADRANYRFDWVIFQGQRDDWVVRNIQNNAAWLPLSIRNHVVDTDSSHSHNVAASGEVGNPLYPGEIMADKSLLSLSLYPRTDLYFSETATPSADLARNQRTIFNGIVEFAGIRNLFLSAYTAVSDFVVRLFTEKFPRDPSFDDEAVDGLSQLLREKVEELDLTHAVRFGDNLLADVERGLRPDTLGTANHFGGGSFRAVRRLTDVIDQVFATVSALVADQPSLAVHLASSNGSLEVFQERAARLIGTLLSVRDDETQLRAVMAAQTVSKVASAPALVRSGMIGQVASYSRQKARLLSDEPRHELAEVYTALSQRSPAIKSVALATLTEDVVWHGGRSAPLWSLILDKNQVETLVAADAPTFVADPQQLKFLGNVIERAGADGKSPETAAKAIGVYEQYLTTAIEPVAREDAVKLRDAVKNAPFASIRIDGMRALDSAGFSGLR